MPIKLPFLDEYFSKLSPEELTMLEQMIEHGSAKSLIEFAHNFTANVTGYEQVQEKHGIYKLVFEYAVSKNKHEFIEELIQEEEIVGALDQEVLYNYAQTQSVDLKHQIIAAMANCNHNNFNRNFAFDLPLKFDSAADNVFFNALSSQTSPRENTSDDEELVRLVLLNPEITHKRDFIRTWVIAFFFVLRNFVSDADKLINVFFQYLPSKKEDQINIVREVIQTHDHVEITEKMLKRMVEQFNLNSKHIVKVLDTLYFWSWTPPSLYNYLIDLIDATHPKYKSYKLLQEYLYLNAEDKPVFLINNLELLSASIFPQAVIDHVKAELGVDGNKHFLNLSIENPEFKFGDEFSESIAISGDYDSIKRFLSTPHVKIPSLFLRNLMYSRKIKDPSELIRLLFSRSDYRLPYQDVFGPLFDLFAAGDNKSISIILNHPPAFEFLKQYHQLDGDGELSMEHRGTLLPKVLSWYLAFSDKANELFFSVSEDYRKELLNGCVPAIVDPDRPLLHAYILRSGNREIIDAIGGQTPRLIKTEPGKEPTFFFPVDWKKPSLLKTLKKIQQNGSVQFSKKQSNDFYGVKESALEIKAIAEKAAAQCNVETLTLQHETPFGNVKDILHDGRLRTRLHIQGHKVLGKVTRGLTVEHSFITNPKNSFSFFTRTPKFDDKSYCTSHLSEIRQSDQARFVINGKHFFNENPHVDFLMIGVYPHHTTKTLILPGGYEIASDPRSVQESRTMMKINFTKNKTPLTAIHEILFERVMLDYVTKLPEPLQSEITQILIAPKNPADLKLASNFLDLLHLEWLVPGDVQLKLSHVDFIEYGDEQYDLKALRKVATIGEEYEVIAAIDSFKNLATFPFVVNGLLEIAVKRNQKNIVNRLLHIKTEESTSTTVYYSREVYEIESLVQLILEDPNNDRVYVHYVDDKIVIKATLQRNSNRAGAHHAEMAKLHYALGVGDLSNKNALETSLEDTLVLPIGSDQQFKTLAEVRDALLTYEITSLLVSKQNLDYYTKNNGEFHPATGKGATNGAVALLPTRLFFEDKPYQIKVYYNDQLREIHIQSDLNATEPFIASAIGEILNISKDKIAVNDKTVVVKISAADFIAKLRQAAIFYEGINVISEEGRLFVAHRHKKGLASAGGHHSDKYSSKGIAHGLASEFGLVFKDPKNICKNVTLMKGVKTISKTGIYLVSLSDLVAVDPTKQFKADPDEFVVDSEAALTLTEMRGKQFYDVMPLKELCQYQLSQLKTYLQEQYPEVYANLNLSIDDSIVSVVDPQVTYKVPADTFGRLKIEIKGEIADELKVILTNRDFESPLVLLKEIKENCQQVNSIGVKV